MTTQRVTFIAAIIASIILMDNGCTEDIDLYTSYEPIPIVYCLLDPDDSIQYVRVGQTFSHIDGDSLKYDTNNSYLLEDFELYITSINEDNENEIVWFFEHSGAVRDSGFFPQEGLQLLSANMFVECNRVYKLYLRLPNSKKLVFGELNSFERKLKVIDPLDFSLRTINLFTDEDFYFRFAPVSVRAVYQAIFTFKFDEIFNGIPERKIVEFPLEIVYGEEYDVEFVAQRFSGERFLMDVGRRLQPIVGVSRIPVGVDFHVSAGGEELYYLIKSENSQSGFSTIPPTNLLNALGIFSSLSHRYINDIKFSRFTIDSLAGSQYTKDLGFVPFSKLLQ